MSELKLIMNQEKADVMSVVEANLGHQSNLIKSEFHEFNVELSLTSQQTQVSRDILLINKNLQHSRRYDLETIHTSTVCVGIKLGKPKSLLIMGGYRQWQSPNFFKQKKNSGSVKCQLELLNPLWRTENKKKQHWKERKLRF